MSNAVSVPKPYYPLFDTNVTEIVEPSGRCSAKTTSNVDGSEELQTTVTQQGLTLKTVMPYKRKDASAYLYADMLKGDLKRIYVVTYTDSVSNGDGGISATWNMVAREITASLTAGLGITVSATFEIAREEEVSNG